MIRRTAAIALALLVILPISVGARDQARIDRALAEVNKVRAENGLTPLRFDPRLMRAAQRHADYMARTNNYSHYDGAGRSPFDRIAAEGYRDRASGENISARSTDPVAVVRGWTRSAVHNRIMNGADYIHAGIGYAVGRRPYWVLLVARPR